MNEQDRPIAEDRQKSEFFARVWACLLARPDISFTEAVDRAIADGKAKRAQRNGQP